MNNIFKKLFCGESFFGIMERCHGRGVILAVFAFCVALISFAASAARADLTVVSKGTLDFSKMKIGGQAVSGGDSSQLQGMLSQVMGGDGMNTTTYYSGRTMKVQSSLMSEVVDLSAGTETTINPSSRTYSISSIGGGLSGSIFAGGTTTVKDGGKTGVILGHPVHLWYYALSGGIVSTKASVWIATDIKDTSLAQFSTVGKGVLGFNTKGLALKTVAEISLPGMFEGSVILSSSVTSISTSALPALTFAIPQGYTKTAPSTSLSGLGDMLK